MNSYCIFMDGNARDKTMQAVAFRRLAIPMHLVPVEFKG
jgi:hypothetical protein